jgi:AraC family transcriptional regulator
LAKIAVDTNGIYYAPQARIIASGDGWTARDVICNAGPRDQPFEEQHGATSIAVVIGGTFQYRCSSGRELMTPGSLLLGNPGESFVCGHEHGTGDRCISFSYAPELFEHLAWESARTGHFRVGRVPPLRSVAPLVAKACGISEMPDPAVSEELSIQLAAQAAQVAGGIEPRPRDPEPAALARVTRVLRMIENDREAPQDLSSLASIARLSRYHFLRTFEELTGTTPHQYLLRERLRRAANRLRSEKAKILEIALHCGFGDISNFNRTFRAEFGVSPRKYRAAA